MPSLTGITDENGHRFSTYTYDDRGRVLTTKHHLTDGSAVNTVGLTYPSPSRPEVTDPLGAVRAYQFQPIANYDVLMSVSQPGVGGTAVASSTSTYDGQRNLATRHDFTGKQVCHAYDLSRNLEAVRVEGLVSGACPSAPNAVLPAGSRKVSTLWHPDWRLPSRVAEPGLVTTLVYNGQPDPTASNAVASCAAGAALLPDGKPIAVLCKKVEQATTDANGAAGFAATAEPGVVARVWKWTYNAHGQVLSEDGPRTDVLDITTYTYHTATAFTGADPNAVGVTVGDLKTVTNAASKTTTYTKYNKHGQVLESIDANSVVSSYSYDTRQRLLSASVGGQTTSYSYDAVGQLKKVTHPDASWTGYDYDGAHRLTAVYDNRGNRVDYQLDNAGNKTAENFKDPGNVLRRQLARNIDVLGRVQQTTGRE